MEIDIKDILSSLKAEHIYYVPNPGNAGDALIAAGTYQLLDKMRINYAIANRSAGAFTGQTVVYGGGGNIGLMRNVSSRFLSRIHKSTKRLIILPHTIKDVAPLLSEFGSNVEIVCRERVSYEYVRSIVNGPRVFLAHDMALHLDVKEILSITPTLSNKTGVAIDYLRSKLFPRASAQAPSMQAIYNLFIADRLTAAMSSLASGTSLNAFRTDSEKTSISIPLDNVDVSEFLAMGVETKALSFLNAFYFLSFLNSYAKIRTNRLHVAIGALLLGKSIDFYGNNYYKCRAVYDYSLADYPDLTFFD